ncbi:hypothetical protein [Vibrio penaeicida]|uniref:Uncharacterized protein n=1 Tax=Vibrio penaeicida TaxID=104609 RepID=A0AAV5NJE3_9VIBR|nr:hypothetical protein [Vibrio penaeicida]GLQ70776.1 hypothetical protein GCM10007932_01360 [Vibrio penaeicida]
MFALSTLESLAQHHLRAPHNLASYVDNELGHTHFHYDKLTQLTRVKTPDDVYKY